MLSPELAAGIDILVVNGLEAESLSGIAVGDLAGAEQAARALSRTFPVAVVTAGGHGVAAAERAGRTLARPAERIRLVSTHGAGDVFTGALAAALGQALPLAEAVEASNRAAARHVAGVG